MNRFIVLSCLLLLLPASVYAQCTMPSGPPAEAGVIVFNDDHKVMQYCNGEKWIGLWGGGASTLWTKSDNDIHYSGGKVGIGTDSPQTLLGVAGAISGVSAAGDWIATQAEAEAGSDNTQVMTPLRVKQAIAANMSSTNLPDNCEAGDVLTFDGTDWICPQKASARFVAYYNFALSGGTATLSADLGTPRPDRHILLAFSGYDHTGQITGVTIGGVTATILTQVYASSWYTTGFAIAAVPEGSSGNITITSSNAGAIYDVAVYRLLNLTSAVPDYAQSLEVRNAAVSLTATVEPGGFVVAAYRQGESNNTLSSVSGVGKDYDYTVSNRRSASGHTNNLGGNRTVTFSGTDYTFRHLSVVSFH